MSKANQPADAKKDGEIPKGHGEHPNGRSEDNDYDDPQANQAKGRRKNAPQGHSGHTEVHNAEPTPVNNTTSHGNRPKTPQQTDHN